MKQIIHEEKEGCIAYAIAVIGNKWTALILRDLFNGPMRFGEIQRSAGGVNPRTLSKRLSELEEIGVLDKEEFKEMPPHTEYSLTKKGRDLYPILEQMSAWGAKYEVSIPAS